MLREITVGTASTVLATAIVAALAGIGSWLMTRRRSSATSRGSQRLLDTKWGAVIFVVGAFLLVGLGYGASYFMSPARPRLTASIDRLGVFGLDDCRVQGGQNDELLQAGCRSLLTLTATVRNHGAPTAVEGWRLTIDVAGAPAIVASPLTLEKSFSITNDEGTKTYTYTPDQYLYNRLLDPLPTGGRKQGVFMFCLKEGYKTELSRPNTAYTLIFHDITGRRYETQSLWPAVATGYLPQLGLD